VAFVLQLSVEVLANHKFINAWLIVANLFVAYGLIRLWQARSALAVPARFVALGLVVIIVAGGVIDLMPVKNQFVIRVPHRDDLKRFLDSRGIGNEIYYPVPFHLQECFADLNYERGAFPHAEKAAAQTIAIPIYSEISTAQQQTVVSAIAEFIAALTDTEAVGTAR